VDKPEDVERTLNQVLADPKIRVSVKTAAKSSPYKAIDPRVMKVVADATTKGWPGLPVIPKMETGASDGIYLLAAGIPTFGVSGIFGDEDDVRAHGRDERVLVKAFDEGVEFMYNVAAALGKLP